MFLLNISSNYRAKFFIGTALNLLSEQGDMYVSDVFACPDRNGSDDDYYNVCIQLDASMQMDELVLLTKSIEKQLGRGSKDIPKNAMPIDIDVLAEKLADNWTFLQKRLPLTADVQMGLKNIEVSLQDVACKVITNQPEKQDWWC